MLLKGPRLLTYCAVLVAIGVIMVLVSVYTPFGRRALLLCSGVPVLTARTIAGKKGAASVYVVTGAILLAMVQPIKVLAYLLVAGAVPLVIGVLSVPLVIQAVITAVLGFVYFASATKLLGLPLEESYGRTVALLPGSGPLLTITAGILLTLGCFLYPIGLKLLNNAVERHWAFQQVFKP